MHGKLLVSNSVGLEETMAGFGFSNNITKSAFIYFLTNDFKNFMWLPVTRIKLDKSRTAHNISIVFIPLRKRVSKKCFWCFAQIFLRQRRSSVLTASDRVTRGSGVQTLCSDPLSEDVEPAPWEACTKNSSPIIPHI